MADRPTTQPSRADRTMKFSDTRRRGILQRLHDLPVRLGALGDLASTAVAASVVLGSSLASGWRVAAQSSVAAGPAVADATGTILLGTWWWWCVARIAGDARDGASHAGRSVGRAQRSPRDGRGPRQRVARRRRPGDRCPRHEGAAGFEDGPTALDREVLPPTTISNPSAVPEPVSASEQARMTTSRPALRSATRAAASSTWICKATASVAAARQWNRPEQPGHDQFGVRHRLRAQQPVQDVPGVHGGHGSRDGRRCDGCSQVRLGEVQGSLRSQLAVQLRLCVQHRLLGCVGIESGLSIHDERVGRQGCMQRNPEVSQARWPGRARPR